MSTGSCDIAMLQLADKFGDYGICGMAIISYQLNLATLELFLLSCRVLGRKVEHAFLNECLLIAKNKGVKKIIAKYNPTKKVIIVKDNNRGIYPSAFSIITGLILEIIFKYIFINV